MSRKSNSTPSLSENAEIKSVPAPLDQVASAENLTSTAAAATTSQPPDAANLTVESLSIEAHEDNVELVSDSSVATPPSVLTFLREESESSQEGNQQQFGNADAVTVTVEAVEDSSRGTSGDAEASGIALPDVTPQTNVTVTLNPIPVTSSGVATSALKPNLMRKLFSVEHLLEGNNRFASSLFNSQSNKAIRKSSNTLNNSGGASRSDSASGTASSTSNARLDTLQHQLGSLFKCHAGKVGEVKKNNNQSAQQQEVCFIIQRLIDVKFCYFFKICCALLLNLCVNLTI